MRPAPTSAGLGRLGFTLLELILVLSLVAITLTIVTASLRGFYAERKVDDAAAHFVALAKQTRARAVDAAGPMRLELDFQEQLYRVSDPRAAVQTGVDVPDDGAVATEWGRWFDLPQAVTMRWSADPSEAGQQVIDFAPDGRVAAFGVVFAGVGDRARLVTCLGAGGTFGVQSFAEGADAWSRVAQLEP